MKIILDQAKIAKLEQDSQKLIDYLGGFKYNDDEYNRILTLNFLKK